jgi:hypothetical protein
MHRLRSVLLVCFPALLLTQLLRAQGAVYGGVSLTNYCYTVNNGLGNQCGTDGAGGTFGGFYNFPIQSRLTAGLDAHLGFGTGSVKGVKGLASVRFGVVPHRNPLRPYLEIGGGFVSSHIPQLTNIVGPQTITSGALEIGVGLDVRITPRVDWRAIELESASGGGTRTAGSASLSTGIVYRFPSARARQS